MNPTRRRRLVAISIGLLGLGIAAGFVGYALRENMQHFISPSDIALGHGGHQTLWYRCRKRSTSYSSDRSQVFKP